ncbi:LOW QUALITY PROTEIN: hypothetical protein CVT26_005475 [Gymnopilus dilepis]|uniref:Uncharacterized protein n=1 Tax=Gymnopilus dilepis TaxID=231916 RepID=A0A409YT64_9AGAR|nr:LOW QUALITY PROTEIN: hypothetical protein CVT26_005475 [Gymnopilus dilepis]
MLFYMVISPRFFTFCPAGTIAPIGVPFVFGRPECDYTSLSGLWAHSLTESFRSAPCINRAGVLVSLHVIRAAIFALCALPMETRSNVWSSSTSLMQGKKRLSTWIYAPSWSFSIGAKPARYGEALYGMNGLQNKLALLTTLTQHPPRVWKRPEGSSTNLRIIGALTEPFRSVPCIHRIDVFVPSHVVGDNCTVHRLPIKKCSSIRSSSTNLMQGQQASFHVGITGAESPQLSMEARSGFIV